MKEQPKETWQFSLPSHVREAIDALNAKGFEAYAVGGAVRDLLRGVLPHDYDITTDATPDEMKGVFSAFRTVETGIAHGTLTVLIGGESLEITTYRVDGSYTDSRHPDSVTFTRSLREDAARRDFTVNAMAYHPREGLFDFFGGEADLAAGLLRTVGDSRRRFTEDALRILRALRFAAVLGFTIEKETKEAIHALAPTLAGIAKERVREELCRLLVGAHAADVLREYADVLSVILPDIIPMIGADQHNPHHDYDIWEHTLHALAAAPPLLHLRLAVLFHDVGKPSSFFLDESGIGHFYGHAARSAEICDRLLRELRFDNETRERVTELVRMHDTLPAPKTRQFSRIRSRHGDEFLSDWLALIRADRTGQKAELSREVEAALAEAEAAKDALLAAEERSSLKNLALNGNDLISLGYHGREIGAALTRALEAVIDGKVENDKESLLAFLQAPPVECERRFLIARPNEEMLLQMGASRSEITQTYLLSDKGVTARVRRRVCADRTVYTHTEKRRISTSSAFETERQITEEEYGRLLLQKDPERHPIVKTRYALPFGERVLEIDVYPFWQRQAVLEIELPEEEASFEIPASITVLREITAEGAYRNAALARAIPAEE